MPTARKKCGASSASQVGANINPTQSSVRAEATSRRARSTASASPNTIAAPSSGPKTGRPGRLWRGMVSPRTKNIPSVPASWRPSMPHRSPPLMSGLKTETSPGRPITTSQWLTA